MLTLTRTVTCALGDRERKRYLTRECKRLARMYGGEFGSQVDPFSAFTASSRGGLSAEYRVTYPLDSLFVTMAALRRRKGRR